MGNVIQLDVECTGCLRSVTVIQRADAGQDVSSPIESLQGNEIVTLPSVLISITGHAAPLATDKLLVIIDNNSFPAWIQQAEEGHASPHNAD